MSAFELARPNDAAHARAISLTRTLYVPDPDGNWRELRLASRAGAAAAGAGTSPRLRRSEFFMMPRAA